MFHGSVVKRMTQSGACKPNLRNVLPGVFFNCSNEFQTTRWSFESVTTNGNLVSPCFLTFSPNQKRGFAIWKAFGWSGIQACFQLSLRVASQLIKTYQNHIFHPTKRFFKNQASGAREWTAQWGSSQSSWSFRIFAMDRRSLKMSK